MTPYEALVAGDRPVATTCEPVPGGVRLSMPEHPHVHDYNAVVLAPDAPFAVPEDVRRVLAFDFAPGAPEGWTADRLLVLAHPGPPPAWPDAVEEVGAAVLDDARRAMWRADGVEGDELADVLAMQERQAAAGTLLAVRREGRPLGWAQVLGAYVNDVFVVPEARRRGLGRVLTLAALAAGARYLSVDPDNAGAIALYRSLGFEDAGTLTELSRG